MLGKHPNGLTKNRLKDCCSLSSARVTPAIAEALDYEWIVPTEIPASSRNKPYDGYTRHPDLVNADSPYEADGTPGILDPDQYSD